LILRSASNERFIAIFLEKKKGKKKL